MIFGNHVAKVKLVEQLTLVTLQTAHHGSTSPRFASTQRNHGSPHPSMTFATKSARLGHADGPEKGLLMGTTGSLRHTVRTTRLVESRCGAVALGRTYLLSPLSSGGALVVPLGR